MKDFGVLLGLLISINFDEFIDETMFPNLKCSINEIVEKTDIKEYEIKILIDKGIFKVKEFFGVQYIIGYSAYGVKNKLEKMIKKLKE